MSVSRRAASYVIGLSALVVVLGCAGMFGGGNANEATASGGASGPITVQNQTAYPICTVDVWQNDGEPRFRSIDLSSTPIAQGGSAVVELTGTAHSLRLVECGDENVLWDSFGTDLSTPHEGITPNGRPFVLAEAGTTVEGNLLALERTPISSYASTAGSLHGEIGDEVLATAQAFATSHNYSEHFTGATVTASDWELNRNRNTGVMVYRWCMADVGAQWPDGHCTIQGMGMIQQHDGSDFVSTLSTQGVSAPTQRQVPCAALSTMQSRWNQSNSSSSRVRL